MFVGWCFGQEGSIIVIYFLQESLRKGPADMGTLAVDPRGRMQICSVYWYWRGYHAGDAPLGCVLTMQLGFSVHYVRLPLVCQVVIQTQYYVFCTALMC